MTRSRTALVVGLLALAPALAADAGKTVLRWHGQSFFELVSSKGTRVVFDPHAIEAYGRVMVNADLVLISHFHTDHSDTSVIVNAQQAKVIPGLTVAEKKVEWNVVDEQFKDVHVRTVGLYHDTTQGMERGKNTAFVVDVDGLRFAFLGDLGHVLTDAQARQFGKVDVLLIPVGGVYTLNGTEAKRVVEQLKPRKYVVPMHYGTPAFDELLPADEFLDEQKTVKKYPGNTLEVRADFKPEKPEIAVLNWK